MKIPRPKSTTVEPPSTAATAYLAMARTAGSLGTRDSMAAQHPCHGRQSGAATTMPLCRASSRLLLTRLIAPFKMLGKLHAQGVPHKPLTIDALLSSLVKCSLTQQELMVLVSLRQQGQDVTRVSPMVPTRGTRARDETAAGSLTSSRSSVLSRPRRSAVEKSFSSSNCVQAGPSLG